MTDSISIFIVARAEFYNIILILLSQEAQRLKKQRPQKADRKK